ncbi:MAG: nuclear transport factor 2 family protein [Henriciella sp.]|uniref:nuclear transport factor 2 family protein n=1 Tax=Henriciella sp. TaxID=1968823 RepID=UPI003C75CC7C
MKSAMPGAVILFTLILAACATTATSVGPEDEADLLRLNEAIFRSVIVDNQRDQLNAASVPSLVVVAPGGMVEDKAAALAGVAAFDASDITLTGQSVSFQRNVATVTGRLDIDGVVRPVGRFGPLKFMSVYLKEGGEWRLVSRSLTPCLPKLIKAGRC